MAPSSEVAAQTVDLRRDRRALSGAAIVCSTANRFDDRAELLAGIVLALAAGRPNVARPSTID